MSSFVQKDDDKKRNLVNARYDRYYPAFVDVDDYIHSDYIRLLNEPYLLITGEPGYGKSHLLAKLVRSRSKDEQFSLIALGHEISKGKNPWKQLMGSLSVSQDSDIDAFLESLESKS